MKTISVMSQKGGIGKTMTATSVAYILGMERGKKVLLIDADQQGNASMLYGRYDVAGIGLSELLEFRKKGKYRASDVIRKTDYENIDIITANSFLMAANMQLLKVEEENQITRLRDSLEEVARGYDYCVIDCGLIMDMTVTNALVASDLVIVPAKIGGFEIDAISRMDEQLEDLRAFNKKLRMKILMTMKQGNKTSEQVQLWMQDCYGSTCFRHAIRRSIVAEKATIEKKPLPAYAKRGIATEDYRDVTDEIIQEMEGRK